MNSLNALIKKNISTIFLGTALSICLAGCYYVYKVLIINPYLATDFGQWIMFSRYFIGSSTPDYIDARSAHPLAPILIGVITLITNNSVLAITIASSILFFTFLISLFVAVKELFNDYLVAILSLFIIGFCQYTTIYMTTGALPQLGALSGINLGIWSISRLSRKIDSQLGWTVLGFTFLYIPFMHIPTAPIYIFTVAIFLLILLFMNPSKKFEILKKIKTYCFFSLCCFGIYFYVYHKVIIEYVTNPASFYRSGINNFLNHITIDNWFVALTLLSLFSIIIISIKCFHIEGDDKIVASIILIEFFGPTIFMICTYILKLGTDYVRFIYYFPTPSLLALIYLVIKKKDILKWNSLSGHKILPWGFDIVFLIVITANLIYTINFYPQIVQRLGLKYGNSLVSVTDKLNQNAEDFTVFAPSRPEGTWIEGLTGKATIFPEEVWYINRPGMIERAYVGNLISLAMPLSLENKYVYIRNQTNPLGIPYNPNVAIEHHGAYANLFTFQDRLVWIKVSDNLSREYNLNLREDFYISSVKEISDKKTSSIKILYTSSRFSITIEKTITITIGSPKVNIKLGIQSLSEKLALITLEFADFFEPTDEELIQRTYIINLSAPTKDYFIIQREDAIGNQILGRLTPYTYPAFIYTPSKIEQDKPYLSLKYIPENVFFWETGFEVSGTTTQNIVTNIKSYRLSDIWKEFNVKYIVIKRTDNYANPIYNENNFDLIFQNWNYNLYIVPENLLMNNMGY